MPILEVGTTQIAYNLRRSITAKQARITVTPAVVEVVVPATATDEQIAGVLQRRAAWLVTETRRMGEKAAQAHCVARFVSGAKVLYRGRLTRLSVVPGEGSLVEVAYRNGFVVSVPATVAATSKDAIIESALRLWLKKRLRQDVTGFVKHHGEPNGLKPRSVQIKEQKHLWGSCGKDRVVNLNWQLVFAPKTVLEYAVVHELCHLRHRTHGPEFWGLVGSILPDWQTRKDWLDRSEHLLHLHRFTHAGEIV